MNKQFITSYEQLRRWATKKIESAHNLPLLRDRVREVSDAVDRYQNTQVTAKGIEVEE